MVCEVLPIIAGLRGSALSNLVVGVTPDIQSPVSNRDRDRDRGDRDRPVVNTQQTTGSLTSYEGDENMSRTPSSVYDHEMEDHFTALLPDDAKARDNAFFNGFYPPKLASTNSNSNYNYNHINSSPNTDNNNPISSGRHSIREDLGLARTHSRREMQSHGNLSARSYGELSDSDYRERRGRMDNSSLNPSRSTFSIFLPWTWCED